MNKMQNRLTLTLNPGAEPADGQSTISADAKAYVESDGSYSTPDSSINVIFELPADSGATFTDSHTSKTSRATRVSSGEIESPVLFCSSKPIDNGQLKAYWESDPDDTLQTAPFTFKGTGPKISLQNNFVSADGKTPITLEVTLSDPAQEGTLKFSEATGTVTFDPPSVNLKAGQTATTNVTCKKAGAYFAGGGSGVTPVELDFLATSLSSAFFRSASTQRDAPTFLMDANKFSVSDSVQRFYVIFLSPSVSPFVSIMLEATSPQSGNTFDFLTNDGSAVDGNYVDMPETTSDVTTDYYVGAFFSTEKNLWLLHRSDQPIFGIV